jgi:site-specific DNA-methyltransferase (adenine-specific)
MSAPYWQGDGISLFLGDCREIDAWLEADVLITDPPYGRAWRQGDLLGHARNAASTTGIANDDTTATRDAALERWGKTRPAVMFGDLMLEPPPNTKLVCVYRKPFDAGLRGAMGGVRRDAEAIYLINKWKSGIGGRSSVFASSISLVGGTGGLVAKNGGHPHTKPGDVMAELISLTDGVIADPFAGSGSTLLAARSQGRPAIGVELEERYCEIAARRLDQGVLEFGDPA